jgi:oligosaccharide repeat unit polymerase
MQLIKLSIFIVLVYFLLTKKSKGWNKRVKGSTIFKIALGAIAVLVLFVAVRTFVGRSNAEDPFYYITKYAGGSIQLLDLFIKNPISESSIWGKETFYAMYKFLGPKLGHSDWVYVFAKEFRRSNGVALGNVYTALRCYYYDFGYIGCIICTGIVGFVFSIVYANIHRNKLKNGVDMRLFLYAYLSYSYCLFSVNYYFDYLNFGFIKYIIFMYLIRWFLLKFKLSLKK